MVMASWSHLLKESNVKYLLGMFLILAAAGCVPKDKAGNFQENADESGSTETVASADDSEENLLDVDGTAEDDPDDITGGKRHGTRTNRLGWLKSLGRVGEGGSRNLA